MLRSSETISYDVRLILLLELGELGAWVHAKRVDGRPGGGGGSINQHGRETQERERYKVGYMS